MVIYYLTYSSIKNTNIKLPLKKIKISNKKKKLLTLLYKVMLFVFQLII